MNILNIGANAWKYYFHVPEMYPECASCGIVITKIGSAYEIDTKDGVKHPKTGATVICSECRDIAGDKLELLEDGCLIEKVKIFTNAEERIRARETTFAKDKEERAAEFRKERSRKAARTRAKRKKAKSESGTGDSRRSGKAGGDSGGSRSKKGRVTKVRKPKRNKNVDSVDGERSM